MTFTLARPSSHDPMLRVRYTAPFAQQSFSSFARMYPSCFPNTVDTSEALIDWARSSINARWRRSEEAGTNSLLEKVAALERMESNVEPPMSIENTSPG